MYLGLSALFYFFSVHFTRWNFYVLIRLPRYLNKWRERFFQYTTRVLPIIYLVTFVSALSLQFNYIAYSNPLITGVLGTLGEFHDMMTILLVSLVILTTELCFYLSRFRTGLSSSNYVLHAIIALLGGLLTISFSTTNLLLFFVCFEATLLPIVALIHKFGSREKKSLAANYIFVYTVVGSIFLLPALLDIGIANGSFNIVQLYASEELILGGSLTVLFCIIAFMIKIPTYPLHNWLTHAHVEAPTIGSVILAALLLKLGTYGLIRVVLPVFPNLFLHFKAFGQSLATISTLLASAMALRQLDLKRIVAYSSIAHMNFGLLALFNANADGLISNIILMFGHGLVAAGLFMVVGLIYDRFKSKLILEVGGLRESAPILGTLFLVFAVANFGFPGTVNFVAELLVLRSMLWSTHFFLVAPVAIIASVAFTLWMYIRVYSGTSKQYADTGALDLTGLDIIAFSALALTIIKFGLSFNGIAPYVS